MTAAHSLMRFEFFDFYGFFWEPPMNPLDFLDGYKTYLAGAGLFGLAIYQLSQNHLQEAYTTFMSALAVVGLRHAITTETKS